MINLLQSNDDAYHGRVHFEGASMVDTEDEDKKGLLFGIHGDNLSNFESDDASMYSGNTSIRKLEQSQGSVGYGSKMSSS